MDARRFGPPPGRRQPPPPPPPPRSGERSSLGGGDGVQGGEGGPEWGAVAQQYSMSLRRLRQPVSAADAAKFVQVFRTIASHRRSIVDIVYRRFARSVGEIAPQFPRRSQLELARIFGDEIRVGPPPPPPPRPAAKMPHRVSMPPSRRSVAATPKHRAPEPPPVEYQQMPPPRASAAAPPPPPPPIPPRATTRTPPHPPTRTASRPPARRGNDGVRIVVDLRNSSPVKPTVQAHKPQPTPPITTTTAPPQPVPMLAHAPMPALKPKSPTAPKPTVRQRQLSRAEAFERQRALVARKRNGLPKAYRDYARNRKLERVRKRYPGISLNQAVRVSVSGRHPRSQPLTQARFIPKKPRPLDPTPSPEARAAALLRGMPDPALPKSKPRVRRRRKSPLLLDERLISPYHTDRVVFDLAAVVSVPGMSWDPAEQAAGVRAPSPPPADLHVGRRVLARFKGKWLSGMLRKISSRRKNSFGVKCDADGQSKVLLWVSRSDIALAKTPKPLEARKTEEKVKQEIESLSAPKKLLLPQSRRGRIRRLRTAKEPELVAELQPGVRLKVRSGDSGGRWRVGTVVELVGEPGERSVRVRYEGDETVLEAPRDADGILRMRLVPGAQPIVDAAKPAD